MPHDRLQVSVCRTFAHLQLRQYREATDHLNELFGAGDLAALQSIKKYLYETYPNIYPGQIGMTSVPWAGGSCLFVSVSLSP
jgi:hypothetical protein